MKSEQATRVRDVSRPGGRVSAELEASEAAEVLVSLCVVAGEEDYSTYDLGVDRLRQARASLTAGLRADIADLTRGYEKLPAHLLGLVVETPRPRTFAAFFERLEALPTDEIFLNLLGYNMTTHRPVPRERIAAAAAGDIDAQAEFLESEAEWPGWREIYSNVFEWGAERIRRQLVHVLPRWYEEAFSPFRAEAMAAIESDAADRATQLTTTPPEEMSELLTSGYRYVPGPEVSRLVFFPSYFIRPWVLLGEHKQSKIFCYPAAVAREPRDVPSGEMLARLYKALGDEGRLRLLKELRSGPLTLSQATEKLGVAKSTTHHHLSILRHAGLVLVRDAEGKDRTEYSLRDDLLPGAGDLLSSFLDA